MFQLVDITLCSSYYGCSSVLDPTVSVEESLLRVQSVSCFRFLFLFYLS
jgi:hypothetical protein